MRPFAAGGVPGGNRQADRRFPAGRSPGARAGNVNGTAAGEGGRPGGGIPVAAGAFDGSAAPVARRLQTPDDPAGRPLELRHDLPARLHQGAATAEKARHEGRGERLAQGDRHFPAQRILQIRALLLPVELLSRQPPRQSGFGPAGADSPSRRIHPQSQPASLVGQPRLVPAGTAQSLVHGCGGGVLRPHRRAAVDRNALRPGA